MLWTVAVLLALIGLGVVVWSVVLLVREDRHRRRRPHPSPEEGGDSFGDTTHWGGWGRPG